jgi:4-hydroxy-tetrahydrodipicolinate synthase
MTMENTIEPRHSINGVFPVLPTPFDNALAPDLESLRCLVRYLLCCGVDGMTFPGVASEFAQLSEEERAQLSQVVLDEVAGRVPVVIGVSSSNPAMTLRLAQSASRAGAAALMVAAPAHLPTAAGQAAYFSQLAATVPGTPLMLQNVPPPVGAGLDAVVLLDILQAVPAIAYIKEESLPSGQRLSTVRAGAPASLRGVFGGAGGRYITDELRRGACGTMPAIELAEVHVALFKAHRQGDVSRVREIFMRMLPILNIQAVFRWSLTKQVLFGRGLIKCPAQRIAGPQLDTMDLKDVNAFLGDLQDLLLPAETLASLQLPGQAHGKA